MGKHILIATCLLICMAGQIAGSAVESPSDTALLLIDIQLFYFDGGKLPLSGSIEASLKAKALLQHCREKKMPIIHICHLPAGVRETSDPSYAFHVNVLPNSDEKVIVKHDANSFRNTELLRYLQQQHIKKLIICGMQTHMCVEAAVRAAADLGFTVTVVHDACATRDLSFQTTTVPAAAVHAAVFAALKGAYAIVLSTAEVLQTLQ